MNIQGKEFKISPVTIRERRVLKEKGIHFMKEVEKSMMEQEGDKFKFPSLLLETVLELKFSSQEDDLDSIGIAGQMQLFSEIMGCTLNGTIEKNSLASGTGTSPEQEQAQ